ncbi:DUF4282 domain-containing protein [Nocardioides solisilvae]|uniref:DUF4282 domain-containing protein n=1 Tax=Nocardioides solisilvae TaxID=1542435 RepID=UPI000D74C72A|nr:DUF4282 domain-containing protein [Nocardioides solisilvae]
MSGYGNPPENPYGQGGQGESPYGYGDPGQQPQQYGGGYGDGGQGYAAYGGGYGDPGVPQGPQAKGFFASLFDFSFSSFITPTVVKAVYALSVGLLTLFWLFFVLAAFIDSPAAGIGVLVVGPLILVLYLCLIRMTLEFYVAVVRMSEDIHHRLRP